MPPKLTVEQFIQRSTITHQAKYDYSKVVYTGTHNKVIICCPLHGEYEQSPMSHMKGIGCKQCGLEQKKQTCLEKYGVDNPRKSTDIKNKIKQTWLETYGVDNPLKSSNIKNKVKQTCLEKYGVDNPRKSTDIKNKIKLTCLEKYGVDNPSKSYNIQDKKRDTVLTKFGVDNPRKSEVVKNGIKQTVLDRYGVDHHSQQHLIDILPLITDYDWLLEQYINQNKTATQIANELGTSGFTVCNYLKKHEIEIKQFCAHSFKAIQWLDSIMKSENIHIQHAGNDGEYRIPSTRYKADGYCKETNTVYEFYGDYWHGNPTIFHPDVINESTNCTMGELYQKTIKRELDIQRLGYNMIIIWENDW